MYKLQSGRRILGTIKPTETRDVYLWSSNFTKDRGVTRGLDSAIRILLREARMSPRQYEIDLVDVKTGKRRSLEPSSSSQRDPNPFSKPGYYTLVNRNGYAIVHFKTRKEALAAKKSGGYSEPGDSSYWPKVVYSRETLASVNW